MAALTLTQLRARVRQHLRLENQTDVSDSSDYGSLSQDANTDLINEIGKRVWSEVATLAPEQMLEQTTMTYTANTEEVALPSAANNRIIRHVYAVRVSGSTNPSDRERLTPVDRDGLADFEDSGDPLAWTVLMSSRKIALRPMPTSSTVLYLLYNPIWTVMSSSGSTPDQLPEDYHDLLAWGAAAEFLAQQRDPQAEYWREKFDARLEVLKAYIMQTYPTTRYRRRRKPDYSRSM